MGWPAVQGYNDGDDVVASVLNKPIGQLAERTDYLRRLLEMNDRTKVVISAGITAPPGTSNVGTPSVGQPVYRIPESGSYALAAAVTSEGAWFYADDKAMAVGIVGSVDAGSTRADIILYGFKDFGSSGVSASSIIADENPVSGRYYLSHEYGKLTSSPAGPVIYVCDCQIAYDEKDKEYKVRSMLVSPQYRDTGESHIHRSFVISGKPAGGYAYKDETAGVYRPALVLVKDTIVPASSYVTGLKVIPCGRWTSDKTVTYTLKLEATSLTESWSDYKIKWTSSAASEGSGYCTIAFAEASATSDLMSIGSYGFTARLENASGLSPKTLVGSEWRLVLPDDAQCWFSHTMPSGDGRKGFRHNLGMYPEMARYIPPVPANGASLTVDGADRRGSIFKRAEQDWSIEEPDADGGPWLFLAGGGVAAGSTTPPFVWKSNDEKAQGRPIVLCANRMRVGPTGFVTSLQPADGAPIRITSAQTGATAVQGALQINLDVDFTTSDTDVEGHRVVKRITGSTFETGPVVERVVAGPGISVIPANGQGSVTVSASNAVYSGDFETIALKNAKQDVAGGIFPYTKLLKWAKPESSNIASGFTAKFRVPDHIRYRKNGYNVIVSASVFGEVRADSDSSAAFRLQNFVLADYACSLTMPKSGIPDYLGRFSAPQEGIASIIPINFTSGYDAFDPILIHGFDASVVPNLTQRKHVDSLLLKHVVGSATEDVVVYPGYFVGISIDRYSPEEDSSWYTGPIGIMSLRWNLVEVPGSDD